MPVSRAGNVEGNKVAGKAFYRCVAEPLEKRRLLAAQLVADLNPTNASSSGVNYTNLNGTAIFSANRKLYRSDGSTVTPIATLNSEINSLQVVGNAVYYIEFESGASKYYLWKTDGTSAGTSRLTQLPVGNNGSWAVAPTNLQTANGKLYFNIDGSLYGTDTSGSTPQLLFSAVQLTNVVAYNGATYFGTSTYPGEALYRTDGTTAGTTLVKTIDAAAYDLPARLTVSNGLLYFAGVTTTTGEEPWRSDGTAAGTFMLRDIAFGDGSSRSSTFTAAGEGTVFLTVHGTYYTNGTTVTRLSSDITSPQSPVGVSVNGVALFTGWTYQGSFHLFRSDGTVAGTYAVENLRGTEGSNVQALTVVGNRAWFSANTSQGVSDLYQTDGTVAGTLKMTNAVSGGAQYGVYIQVAVGGRTFFGLNDVVHGFEPWTSDGTAAGTRMLADLNTQPYSSDPGGPYPGYASQSYAFGQNNSATLGNSTLFPANGALWKSDGTAAGTVQVHAHWPGQSQPVRFLTEQNGRAFFLVDDINTTVWSTDGTEAGTVRLIDPYVAYFSSPGRKFFVPFKGAMYFLSDDALWKSDGTKAGTVKVFANLGQSGGLFANDNGLYFNSSYTNTFYKSDGTTAGTQPFSFGMASFSLLASVGSTLYINGTRQVNNVSVRGLYKSDGTAAGTTLVRAHDSNIRFTAVLNGSLYYSLTGSDRKLYKSDGTPEGTFALTPDLALSPQFLTPSGDKLYFLGSSTTTGAEPWVSDGTVAGTHLVADINSGTDSSLDIFKDSYVMADNPFMALPADEVIATVNDGTHGVELYRLTPTDAALAADVYPGSAGSGARPISVVTPPGATAPVVLFSAADPIYGRELWGFSLATTGSISGVVFDDTNADGIRQSVENPLADEAVYLDLNNNSQYDATEPTVLTTSTGYTFSNVNVGSYAVRLKPPVGGRRSTTPNAVANVTVSEGATAIATPDFGVTGARPNAVIGGPGSVGEGAAITLDGSASNEAFGTIASYAWDFNYDGVTFDVDAAGATPKFDAGQIDGPASRTVALRVTDANGLASLIVTRTISITNVAPTAEFGGTRVGEAGQPLAFGWTNPIDPGVGDGVGRKFGYDYNNDGDFTDAGEANDARPSAGYVFATAGTYTVHGRVTDKDGAFTDYYTTVAIYPSKPTSEPGTTLEGESATFAGGSAKGSSNSGYTGTGYADFGGQNSSAQWSLTRTAAGAATVTFRYANGGTANRPLSILVNGTAVGSVACVPTGSWAAWNTVSIDVSLAAGANTIKAVATSTSGGGNVDNLAITPPPVTPPAWLAPGDAVWWLANNTLVIKSGNATLLADAGLASPGLSIVLAGGTLTSNTSQHLATLGIGGGQFLMPATGGKVLRVTALAGFGMDLKGNDLILDYAGTSPADEVMRWLKTGSITTTAARPRKGTASATPPRVLGYSTGATYLADGNSTFAGETIDATSFLIKSTFAGDATLDGHVDFNDFLRLQNNFGKTDALFTEGDFNSDAIVNFNDFLVLQNNFGVA